MNKRVDGLNFIRIIGMTMILLFHAKLLYGFSVDLLWLDNMISIGAIFVTVFFMLSGFGLRKSYGDLSIGDRQGLLRYYKKRVLAIYPLFFLLSVVALVFQFRVMDSWGETLARLPIQFSMLHILFGKEMHGFLFNDNCWYISALFVLYLLFPALNEIVKRLSVWAKICLCVVLWLVSVSIYFYCVYCTELVFLDYYPNPFLRIPEFMIGMMVADLSEEIATWKNSQMDSSSLAGSAFHKTSLGYAVILGMLILISITCLLALYPYFKQETNLYGVLMIPCTAICFIVTADWDWLNRIGGSKIVRWLAGLGLEVYLCQSFATLTMTIVKVDGGWDEVWFVGLSIVFAVFVNTLFMGPIYKMARK